MTRREYEDARRFMEGLGVEVPPAQELPRGGIIGSVNAHAETTFLPDRYTSSA